MARPNRVPSPSVEGRVPSGGAGPDVLSARDPWFDNAKFGLIVLVVVGHVIETFRSEVLGAGTAYVLIYGFHMPAFVFIAGFFSKGSSLSARRLTAMFTQLLVPYVIFQSLYALWAWRVEDDAFGIDYLTPDWIMWFLLAVFLWRMATPLLQRLRFPFATSVAVALIAGLFENVNRYLTLHRVLALLPFFVLGLVVQTGHVTRLRQLRYRRAIAVAILASVVPAARWAANSLPVQWFYHRSPYADLDASVLQGLATRSILLIVGLSMGAAFLALVPEGRSWITRLGEASMYPYLLHGFVVLALGASGIAGRINTVPEAVLAVVFAVVATAILSAQPTRWLVGSLVAPPVAWLFTPKPPPIPNAPTPSDRPQGPPAQRP